MWHFSGNLVPNKRHLSSACLRIWEWTPPKKIWLNLPVGALSTRYLLHNLPHRLFQERPFRSKSSPTAHWFWRSFIRFSFASNFLPVSHQFDTFSLTLVWYTSVQIGIEFKWKLRYPRLRPKPVVRLPRELFWSRIFSSKRFSRHSRQMPPPKQINFRKSSKRPLTPPHFRKIIWRILQQKCLI